MPSFRYSAYDPTGKLKRGEIASLSRAAAIDVLRRRGEFPIDIDAASDTLQLRWWEREVFASQSFRPAELALFTRELATLVAADIPLEDALRLVSLQPALGSKMRNLSQTVLARVREGQALSDALADRAAGFPEYYWRLVQAGEASGALGPVLDDLAQFLERSTDTRGQVLSALLYPAILIVAACAALAVIMNVLLPTIVPLFKDAGATPPVVIQVLADVHDFVARYWYIFLASCAGLCLAALLAFRNERVRLTLDQLVLRLPLIGRLTTYRETARFSGTLGTLIRNGVPLLDAVRISGAVLQNRVFAASVQTAEMETKEGVPLSRPLARSGLFPELAVRLISVGEQTGQLDAMLTRVATIHEHVLQRLIARTMSLLTPMLTLVTGALVGGLIISVMGAILSVNDLAFQ